MHFSLCDGHLFIDMISYHLRRIDSHVAKRMRASTSSDDCATTRTTTSSHHSAVNDNSVCVQDALDVFKSMVDRNIYIGDLYTLRPLFDACCTSHTSATANHDKTNNNNNFVETFVLDFTRMIQSIAARCGSVDGTVADSCGFIHLVAQEISQKNYCDVTGLLRLRISLQKETSSSSLPSSLSVGSLSSSSVSSSHVKTPIATLASATSESVSVVRASEQQSQPIVSDTESAPIMLPPTSTPHSSTTFTAAEPSDLHGLFALLLQKYELIGSPKSRSVTWKTDTYTSIEQIYRSAVSTGYVLTAGDKVHLVQALYICHSYPPSPFPSSSSYNSETPTATSTAFTSLFQELLSTSSSSDNMDWISKLPTSVLITAMLEQRAVAFQYLDGSKGNPGSPTAFLRSPRCSSSDIANDDMLVEIFDRHGFVDFEDASNSSSIPSQSAVISTSPASSTITTTLQHHQQPNPHSQHRNSISASYPLIPFECVDLFIWCLVSRKRFDLAGRLLLFLTKTRVSEPKKSIIGGWMFESVRSSYFGDGDNSEMWARFVVSVYKYGQEFDIFSTIAQPTMASGGSHHTGHNNNNSSASARSGSSMGGDSSSFLISLQNATSKFEGDLILLQSLEYLYFRYQDPSFKLPSVVKIMLPRYRRGKSGRKLEGDEMLDDVAVFLEKEITPRFDTPLAKDYGM